MWYRQLGIDRVEIRENTGTHLLNLYFFVNYYKSFNERWIMIYYEAFLGEYLNGLFINFSKTEISLIATLVSLCDIQSR